MDSSLISSIRTRYQHVLSGVADASEKSGQKARAVQVIVVSKSKPLQVIQAAVAAGISKFGENYTEEAVEKITGLEGGGVEWHMIGHVQSRKAETVAEYFSMLHSLDSVKLAARLDRSCGELNRRLPVLLEFNMSGEGSKFGFQAWDELHWPDLETDMEEILNYPNIRVCGLMTMPPFFDDPENSRPYFIKLRRLQEYLAKRFPQAQWKELSMGTSVDFVVAIQEGASYVRIGRAILGSRTE
jgi:pyridoxal phosphate enzyme (YggS family)